jgi:hypothetical protein
MKQRGFISILSIIFVAIIGLAGFYFYLKKNPATNSEPDTRTEVVFDSPTSHPTEPVLLNTKTSVQIPIGWKLYTNTKQKYTIGYPVDELPYLFDSSSDAVYFLSIPQDKISDAMVNKKNWWQVTVTIMPEKGESQTLNEFIDDQLRFSTALKYKGQSAPETFEKDEKAIPRTKIELNQVTAIVISDLSDPANFNSIAYAYFPNSNSDTTFIRVGIHSSAQPNSPEWQTQKALFMKILETFEFRKN